MSRLTEATQHVMHLTFGWVTRDSFLERFRYIIVASQLLNDSPHRPSHKPFVLPEIGAYNQEEVNQNNNTLSAATPAGLLMTLIFTFMVVGLARWVQIGIATHATILHLILRAILLITALMLINFYLERQRLHHLRLRALKAASRLVTSLHDIEALISSSITFVQETELVAHGYNM